MEKANHICAQKIKWLEKTFITFLANASSAPPEDHLLTDHSGAGNKLGKLHSKLRTRLLAQEIFPQESDATVELRKFLNYLIRLQWSISVWNFEEMVTIRDVQYRYVCSSEEKKNDTL